MELSKGTALRYCPQRNMHDGTIIPPRMTYTRRLNGSASWSHTVDECIYGSAVLQEPIIGGYHGWFFNRDEETDEETEEVVMLLSSKDKECFNHLDANALVGWEWDSYHNWWYPVKKYDITKIKITR